MSTQFAPVPSTRIKRLRRRRERGAIIFIVAMTLTLLAGMGVYALTNTTSEIRTSGYQRQAVQAHYVSDLATGAAVDVFTPENASYIDNQMRTTTPSTPCISAPPVAAGVSDITKRCVKFHPKYVEKNWNGAAPLLPNALGNTGYAPTGGFRVEVTESINTGIRPGYDTNNNKCFYRYTISSFGWLQQGTDVVGEEASRARVVIGPFDCGG
jgi:Tfp pilus assembly protein PilX